MSLQRSSYPSNADLEEIRTWEPNDIDGLIEHIRPQFEGFGTIRPCKGGYTLKTGGWSGNEEIIKAMLGNMLFCDIYYQSWERGGRYVFAKGR